MISDIEGSLEPLSIDELRAMAAVIRCDIIDMISTAQAGHPGGSLSAADIVTALYFRVMRIDPRNPGWPDRDRFILSKGHACPVWYSALAERGYFDKAHLGTLRRIDSILQGHPDMRKTPGIDMTAGSLGQGLSAGLGMALSGKLRGQDYHVWIVLGDGETQEGSVWEAAMAASKWQLANLTAIVDRNRLQNDACVKDVMPLGALAEKWRAFGWHVIDIDGHDMAQVVEALEAAKDLHLRPVADPKPVCIIAHTVKGKGVSYMEDAAEWHGRAPCEEEALLALDEIREAACEPR
jgi:transketolase